MGRPCSQSTGSRVNRIRDSTLKTDRNPSSPIVNYYCLGNISHYSTQGNKISDEHLGKIISPGPIDLNCQAVQEHSCQGRGITIAALLDLLLDPRSAGIDAVGY